MTRNPDETRKRILDAALKEFARHGFAGARVDVIAREARINKRMLYHYFGDKDGLFREVLRQKVSERKASMSHAPENLWDALPALADLMASDPDWIRLLQFEALQWGDGKLIDEARRKSAFQFGVQQIRAQQKAGIVSPDLDAAQLLLAILGMTAYPFAFPQLARLVTGMRVSSPEFQKKRKEFLRNLGSRMRSKR